MDIVAVEEIRDAVLAELRGMGRSEKTLRNYSYIFDRLGRLCPGGAYSPPIGHEFAKERHGDSAPLSSRYMNAKKLVVRSADRYMSGEAPYWGNGPMGGKTKLPRLDGHVALLDELRSYCEERGLAPKTAQLYGYSAALYLSFLEGRGTGRIEDAGIDTVGGFLAHMRRAGSKQSEAHWISNLRPLFVVAERDDLYRATQLARARTPHGPVAVLDDDQEAALVRICTGGSVSRKCAALTMLALATGMRESDIAQMRIADIDWGKMQVSVVQQKTGNPVTLPLLPAVASLLADYILEERGPSDCDRVFLHSGRPYARANFVYSNIELAFAAAGIEGVPAGTRTLRHNAATKLLRKGAPLPTISAVLGHSSPITTGAYLEMDEEGMVACVLPMPKGAAS